LGGNHSINPSKFRIKLNGFVGQTHTFIGIRVANGDVRQGFRVVSLFRLLGENAQFRVGFQVAEALFHVKYVVPLGEGDLESLAKHGSEEKEE
jgi:hypothetical protein